MATKLYVSLNGMVQHQHPGVKGWSPRGMHDPAQKHEQLHREHRAKQATGLRGLSAKLKDQYLTALSGNSWMLENKKVSRARRQAAGQSICDARCTNAHPDSPCDCVCGGDNHGAAFVAEEKMVKSLPSGARALAATR